ncbi:HBL144Cp [Eremothecium sinecaudum]|uniref:HBL144Cp n=1 Tax=Eremothecium sinecaudum TaxID=45286 RepID=A0A109UWG3_9SACH|nr:HBL144Cp [Eremothecium sinecaudum]AMD18758.1 HBL144Cp [Eremothecium sinecaudum]
MINETIGSGLKGATVKEQARSPAVGSLRSFTPVGQSSGSKCEEREQGFKCHSGDSIELSWSYGRDSPCSESCATIFDDTLVSLPKKYLEQDVDDEQMPRLAGRRRHCSHSKKGWWLGNEGVIDYNAVVPAVVRPTTTTNWLKPLMAFQGYQISGYKKYQVHVLLQTVELPALQHPSSTTSPHMTGFLTIRGLTNQHPEITTFFEAFAVNETIGFISSSMPFELDDYKSTDRVDLEHWLNFPSFKELCMLNDSNIMSDIMEGNYTHRDYLARRYIFMRWKEKFLVPDEEVGNVEGASYDGYYYIVHDQITGNVLGFYYHKDAEKFQQLELTPIYQMRKGVCKFDFT